MKTNDKMYYRILVILTVFLLVVCVIGSSYNIYCYYNKIKAVAGIIIISRLCMVALIFSFIALIKSEKRMKEKMK